MLEVGLVDNVLENVFLPVNAGFESDIFISEYYNFIKIFKYYVPNEILFRKEHILIALSFSEIYDNYSIIPRVNQLLYTKNGVFSGYSMEAVSGERLNNFCENMSTEDILFLFKNLESTIKIIHDNGFCLTDFNPANILVSKDFTFTLVDIDSFCLMNDSAKHIFCNYKYICPFSKVIDRKYNIYSFYCLLLDILFKVNRKHNTKKEILKKIAEEKKVPESIKEKLVYFINIWTKKGLQKLDYLF